MKLTLLDSIAHPAKTVNEDIFAYNSQAAWVFDGATGIAKDTIPGAGSDPAWLVQTVSSELARVWDDTRPTRDLLLAASEATIARYNEILPDAPPLIERPTACFAIARLKDGRLEIGRLHDSGVMHQSADRTVVYGCVGRPDVSAGPRNERARLYAAGVPQSEFHERLLPFERAFREKANVEGGYDIVDTTTRWVDRIEWHSMPARPGDRLLLLTDGFYRLIDVFQKYDAASLVEAASTRGLSSLYNELRETEAKDSLCTMFPRAKISDDVAAALITL